MSRNVSLWIPTVYVYLACCWLLPAALHEAQTCRYLVYSEANFEVFRPAGATRCTDGGEIWHGGGDQRSPPPKRSGWHEGSHSFTCHFTRLSTSGMTYPSFTPQPQSITALWLVLINFTPIGATTGVGPPKLKFVLRFDRNLEYKRPAGAYPLRDFHKICRVCTSFQDVVGC